MQFASFVKVQDVVPEQGQFWDFSCLKHRRALPEEKIRFGLLKSLQEFYGYQPLQLTTEAPLWLKGRFSFRADIIVWRDDHQTEPFILLETKAPQVGLTDDHVDKLIAYSACFPAQQQPRLLVLTNGDHTLVWDCKARKELTTIPTLRQAVRGFGDIPAIPAPRPFRRPKTSPYRLRVGHVDARFDRFGELKGALLDTDTKRAFLALYELFLDEQTNLVSRGETLAGYSIEADHGVRWSSFGNASGGRFYGRYRHLRLVTPQGRKRNFCLSVSTYVRNARRVHADCLAVIGGIDGKQALQLQSDSPEHKLEPAVSWLVHRGRISLGEGGAIGRERVAAFVERHAPELFDQNVLLACKVTDRSLRDHRARSLVLRLGVLSDVLARLREEVRAERRPT